MFENVTPPNMENPKETADSLIEEFTINKHSGRLAEKEIGINHALICVNRIIGTMKMGNPDGSINQTLSNWQQVKQILEQTK